MGAAMNSLSKTIHDFLHKVDTSDDYFSPDIFELLDIPFVGLYREKKIWYCNPAFWLPLGMTVEPAVPFPSEPFLEPVEEVFAKTGEVVVKAYKKSPLGSSEECYLIGYVFTLQGPPRDELPPDALEVFLGAVITVAELKNEDEIRRTFISYISHPLQGSPYTVKAANRLHTKISKLRATLDSWVADYELAK
jgi:hypothetical protein